MILPKGLDTQPLGRDVLGIWRRMVSGQGSPSFTKEAIRGRFLV